MSDRLPAIFFGHGNPMNALTNTDYTRGWRRIGEQTPVPKGILAISAHWYVPRKIPLGRNLSVRDILGVVIIHALFGISMPLDWRLTS